MNTLSLAGGTGKHSARLLRWFAHELQSIQLNVILLAFSLFATPELIISICTSGEHTFYFNKDKLFQEFKRYIVKYLVLFFFFFIFSTFFAR